MVTADQVYADPSALARLFLNQPGARELSLWRRRCRGSLPLTHHGRVELANALALAAFRGDLEATDYTEALAELADEFTSGRMVTADILWRTALNRAADLSSQYTPLLGTRAADVLHVACALELKLSHFLTFDERQRKLAETVGLKLIRF